MPILDGDTFYAFVCTHCNQGSECLKRLDPTWPDLVQLILFNLTGKTKKDRHAFHKDIVPYIDGEWPVFQVPYEAARLDPGERQAKVRGILEGHPERFKKSGKDCWSLTVFSPPPAPRLKPRPSAGRIISERTVLDDVVIRKARFDPDHCDTRIASTYKKSPPKKSKAPKKVTKAKVSSKAKPVVQEESRLSCWNKAGFPRVAMKFCTPYPECIPGYQEVKKPKETTKAATPTVPIIREPDSNTTNTLERFIPVPKDFNGANHPFLARPVSKKLLLQSEDLTKNGKVKKHKPSLTLHPKSDNIPAKVKAPRNKIIGRKLTSKGSYSHLIELEPLAQG